MGDIFAQAFGDNPSLEYEVRQWLGTSTAHPSTANLPNFLTNISYHTISLQTEIHNLKRKLSSLPSDDYDTTSEPSLKKRKLPVGGTGTSQLSTNGEFAAANGSISPAAGTLKGEAAATAFEMPEISFSVPVRKKLTVEIAGSPGPSSNGCIRGRNDKTGEVECEIKFGDIDQIISVPVPEKAQPSSYFVVLPTASALAVGAESMVWTVPVKPVPHNAYRFSQHSNATVLPAGADDTYDNFLSRILTSYTSTRVVVPDPNEFASKITQPHLKSDTAYHIKSFRGSKDGFLYLLPPGILFGFRKPLLFFPFSSIESISYSAVLQRTFNLNIEAEIGGKKEEFEFAMLDQKDFEGVDTYIKKHGLNDASLAAERKAKVFNVNKPRGTKDDQAADAGESSVQNGVAATGEEESELARAEREIQDAEDEEEEDFDPGSGGESDGSGSSDGEEDEGYDDEAQADDDEEADGNDDDEL